MIPTRPERIADLQRAIERHKSLLLLLTSWTKAHEAVIERSVTTLRSLRTAITQIERELAEAEAQLAKLESQPLAGTDAAPVPPQTKN